MLITGVAALFAGSAAQAQVPSYAVAPQAQIGGTVQGFDGAYTMYVRDQRGYVDRVSLHQGTVINPTGLRLQQGMRVTIYGYPSGQVFVANEIDTPYRYVRAYAYPGYPYWYTPYWGVGLRFGGWGGWGWHR